MNSKELNRLIFESWREVEHPRYFNIVGAVGCLLLLSLLVSVAFILWFDWWWKMTIATVVLIFVARLITSAITEQHIQEFNQRHRK